MKQKRNAILNFITSMLFFASSVINFSCSDTGTGFVHIIVSAIFLYLAKSKWKNRNQDKEIKDGK